MAVAHETELKKISGLLDAAEAYIIIAIYLRRVALLDLLEITQAVVGAACADGWSMSCVVISGSGERGRDGRLRRALDEVGGDCRMVCGFSCAKPGRASDQFVDSRS